MHFGMASREKLCTSFLFWFYARRGLFVGTSESAGSVEVGFVVDLRSDRRQARARLARHALSDCVHLNMSGQKSSFSRPTTTEDHRRQREIGLVGDDLSRRYDGRRDIPHFCAWYIKGYTLGRHRRLQVGSRDIAVMPLDHAHWRQASSRTRPPLSKLAEREIAGRDHRNPPVVG